MDVLAALPDNIRAEMMHRYGMTESITVKEEVIEVSDDDEPCVVGGKASAGRPDALEGKQTSRPDHSFDRNHDQAKPHSPVALSSKIVAAEDAISVEKGKPCVNGVEEGQDETETESVTNQESDIEEPEGPCEKCGSYVFGFAALAHARWHEQMEADSTEAAVVQ